MPILTIASFKGGPGKTTLCQIISARCAADGLAVAVIDADPTKAMSDWHSNTYEGKPFTCVAETSERSIADLALGLDDTSDLVLTEVETKVALVELGHGSCRSSIADRCKQCGSCHR